MTVMVLLVFWRGGGGFKGWDWGGGGGGGGGGLMREGWGGERGVCVIFAFSVM